MDIALDNLLPHPFKNTEISSGVWGKKLLFKKGTKIHIKAPSASGKTTFISMLYGLRRDYDGEILFNSKKTKALTPDEWAKVRQHQLSIVFQDLRLFENITALDNILIKAHLTGSDHEEKIHHLAKKCGIEAILDKKVAHLSRGEKQRIAIIRSLMQPFGWILLDEPFSHLDKENRNKAVDIISLACEEQQGGLILTSLEKDSYFSYQQKVSL
ncbi:MAG: ATP-binding cassette domain-containing protein [Candidatus Pacearchaeota archaeon]|nr:ATP-binding cassette domain-containing protein [Candidatus Pacearchaeota archaeon]